MNKKMQRGKRCRTVSILFALCVLVSAIALANGQSTGASAPPNSEPTRPPVDPPSTSVAPPPPSSSPPVSPPPPSSTSGGGGGGNASTPSVNPSTTSIPPSGTPDQSGTPITSNTNNGNQASTTVGPPPPPPPTSPTQNPEPTQIVVTTQAPPPPPTRPPITFSRTELVTYTSNGVPRVTQTVIIDVSTPNANPTSRASPSAGALPVDSQAGSASKKSNTGVIIGGVVGGLFSVAIIGLVGSGLVRWRNRIKKDNEEGTFGPRKPMGELFGVNSAVTRTNSPSSSQSVVHEQMDVGGNARGQRVTSMQSIYSYPSEGEYIAYENPTPSPLPGPSNYVYGGPQWSAPPSQAHYSYAAPYGGAIPVMHETLPVPLASDSELPQQPQYLSAERTTSVSPKVFTSKAAEAAAAAAAASSSSKADALPAYQTYPRSDEGSSAGTSPPSKAGPSPIDASQSHRQAIMTFTPKQTDEIEVVAGDTVVISQAFSDGWCNGINLRTNLQGAFPMTILSPPGSSSM